jgi:hypothetical protein
MRYHSALATWLLQLLGHYERPGAHGGDQVDLSSIRTEGQGDSLKHPLLSVQPSGLKIDGAVTYLDDVDDGHYKWHGHTARPADGGKAWREAYQQAAELVSQMTVEEKVGLTTRRSS